MIDIKHIAKLSKLRITAQEEEKFAEEMEKIVDMIQNLPQLDDTGALIDPSNPMILREVQQPSILNGKCIDAERSADKSRMCCGAKGSRIKREGGVLMEMYQYTATELSSMLKKKECSAVEVTESVLKRVHAVENQVNAYVTVTEELALKKAEEVDQKRAAGEPLHDLAGIPIAIKDNICTKGVKTTCASRMLENFVPPYNATVIEKLDSCDYVPVGKVNMDEFAMGSSTETSYFKKTSNPNRLDCVPGGSSGGSGAAVSAGEAVLALGSDTGGSIRLPASYCGVVGLKPTYSSVSRYGLVAFASSLDQIGPLGRSVSDVAMLYSAICGHDPHDATSAMREYADFNASLQPDIKGKVIGLPKEYFGAGVSDTVKSKVMEAVKEMERQGAAVKEISLPSTDYALNAYYIISSAEASSNLARFDGVKYGYRAKDYRNLENSTKKPEAKALEMK